MRPACGACAYRDCKSLSILSCALVSVPDPGMWELSGFFVLGFACLLVCPLRLVLRCRLLLYCCLPVPGLWALFVVCGVVVNQVFLVIGCCLFPLFLGEVLSVFHFFWPSVGCQFSFFFLGFSVSLLLINSYLSKKKKKRLFCIKPNSNRSKPKILHSKS